MADVETNFRVEVWTEDGQTLRETVARSSDFAVSLAAWHAAIRKRPGVLLIHKNGDHTMDSILTPGKSKSEPTTIIDGKPVEGFEPILGDLRDWHRLSAFCVNCLNRKLLDIAVLKTRFGSGVTFSTLEARLRCRKCDKPQVRIEITKGGRD